MLNCGFVSGVPAWVAPSDGLSGIVDARMTLEVEVTAGPSQALSQHLRPTFSGHETRPWHVIPARYHSLVAMTLRLPDDLDAKLTERARREGRSKQELAIEAIREAQYRAELKVDDVLAELLDSDAEILDYLK